MKLLSSNKVFSGIHQRFEHVSKTTQSNMQFAVFTPNNNVKAKPLVFLSGLTCTDQNFMQKAGAFKLAQELNLAIICPDTSPRGQGIADAR